MMLVLALIILCIVANLIFRLQVVTKAAYKFARTNFLKFHAPAHQPEKFPVQGSVDAVRSAR